MPSHRLNRVVRALSNQRAAHEQTLSDARRARDALLGELDDLDRSLEAAQRSCTDPNDMHLRSVADRAARRIRDRSNDVKDRIDSLERTRVEPARSAAVLARVREKSVELLAQRRVEAQRAELSRKEQLQTDESAARIWLARHG
ncbi:MAG TPA: flagellar FliJ family protein [Myxococcales bacterium LLY-WYZ-16_1]|nr:flagellar FliJ family protein [Myxococcales bacterium LLY-WYZ-16_1]